MISRSAVVSARSRIRRWVVVLTAFAAFPLFCTGANADPIASDTLHVGDVLDDGQSMYSQSSLYWVQVQDDGNVVVGGLGCTYWDDHTYGTGAGNHLTVQGDGNLVLYAPSGRALWSSKTVGSGSANYLTMQDDGNLVLYTAGGRAVWSSKTVHPGALCANGFLNRGQRLYSFTRGLYRLELQTDGNLVEYNSSDQPVWASNTQGSGAGSLFLTQSGNLLLQSGGGTVWSFNTNTPGAVLNINDYGRLYLSLPPNGGQAVIHS